MVVGHPRLKSREQGNPSRDWDFPFYQLREFVSLFPTFVFVFKDLKLYHYSTNFRLIQAAKMNFAIALEAFPVKWRPSRARL